MALSSSQNKRHDANIKGLIYGMHELNHSSRTTVWTVNKKVKVADTRLPSVGFRSWSRFLTLSLQVTSHKPGSGLPLLRCEEYVFGTQPT